MYFGMYFGTHRGKNIFSTLFNKVEGGRGENTSSYIILE